MLRRRQNTESCRGREKEDRERRRDVVLAVTLHDGTYVKMTALVPCVMVWRM